MSWVRISVDLDDIYDEMSRSDKESMSQWLFEDGILENHRNPKIKKHYSDTDSYMEDSFKKTLGSLWDKYYQMSEEDIKIIENLSKNINMKEAFDAMAEHPIVTFIFRFFSYFYCRKNNKHL